MNRSERQKGKMKKLSALFPVKAIEGEIVHLQSERSAMILSLKNSEAERLSKDELESLHEAVIGLLGDCPAGMMVQRWDAYYYQSHKVGRSDSHQEKKQQSFFHNHQRDHFYHRPAQEHQAYLCVSFGEDDSRPNPMTTGIPKEVRKKPHRRLEQKIAELRRVAGMAAERLRPFGIEARVLEEDELKQLLLAYFNMEFRATHRPSGFNSQLHPDPNGLLIGRKFVKAVSLVGQGAFVEVTGRVNKLNQPFALPLTDALQHPHILVTSYWIEDQEKALKVLDRERKLSRAIGFFGSQENAIREDEIGDFTEEVRRDKLMLVSMNVTVLLMEESEEKVNRAVEATLAAFRTMAGCQPLVENTDTTSIYLACCPGNGAQLFRWLLMSASQAVSYTHFTGIYRSDQEGILLTDRSGNPLWVRLFNLELHNQNSVLIGTPGSGKSFLNAYLIALRHEQGAIQLVIDKGGTYAHLMKALGGAYFSYDPREPLALNPFWVKQSADGKYRLSAEKLVFLTTLLSGMWKGGDISEVERSVLVKFLTTYYKGISPEACPTITGFYNWLKAYDKQHAKEEDHQKVRAHFSIDALLLVLEPFVHGEYRELFNHDENLDISQSQLIGFDVERIKNDRALYPIISLIITEIALEKVRENPDVRKFIYLDEAWSMLSEHMGNFVENMYRTIRKHLGSIAIITQGVNEIVQSPVGQVILDTSSTKIILQHTDEAHIQRFGEVFGFTRHELDKIRSLRKKSHAREVFIKQDDYGKVYSVEVAPELAAVFSSQPEERNRLAALIAEKGGNILFALQQFIEDQNQINNQKNHE